jgi:hypothetical protein
MRWYSVVAIGVAAAACLAPAASVGAQPRTTPPVPNGLQPSSTSWLTPSHGVVLGDAPCGRTAWCAYLLDTSDAGHTWHRLTAPPMLMPANHNQVRIVWISDSVAFATDGNRVEGTYDGTGHWSPITLRGLTDPSTERYWISADGTTFTPEPLPCPAANQALLGGIQQGRAFVLCIGPPADPQPGSNMKQMWVAPGIGKPFAPTSHADPLGESGFAVASRSTAISAEGGGEVLLYRTFDGGRSWTMTLQTLDRGIGVSDLAFLSPTVGVVEIGIPNTTSLPAAVYHTVDGGHTWKPLSIR